MRYCFEGGLEFESVTQLVDYYHRCADGLAYTLRTPFIPATRIDPVLLSFLAGSANSATTAAALNGNDQPLMVQKSANLPPTGASTILHIGSSAVNAVNKRINKMLNNEGIYDSNRMYEVIMNNRSDNNNNTHSDFTNNGKHDCYYYNVYFEINTNLETLQFWPNFYLKEQFKLVKLK